MKIKDEKGNEIEVFTAEDVKSKVENEKKELLESQASLKAELESNKVALTDQKSVLQKQLDSVNEEYEILKGSTDENKKEQVERLLKKNKELTDMMSGYDSKINSVAEMSFKTFVNNELDKYDSGDKDTRDKILVEFNKYMPEKTDDDSIKQRLEIAAKIVGAVSSTNILNISGGGAGPRDHGTNRDEERSEANKFFQKKLKVSEASRKLYKGISPDINKLEKKFNDTINTPR